MRLALIFCLISSFLNAQDRKDRFINVGIGIASGTGSFSDVDGGAASSGTNWDFTFQSKLKHTKTFGYALMIRKQTVGVDKSAIEQQFTPGTNVSVTEWSAMSYMIGFKWSLPIGKKSFIEPKFLFGLMKEYFLLEVNNQKIFYMIE